MEERSNKKKTEVMVGPSLAVVSKTPPNARKFGNSFTTLFRWKDSIYKMVWKHMLIYYLLYVTLTLVYEFLLDQRSRPYFETIIGYFAKNAQTFNLMIILGFFTSTALQRSFTIQMQLPGTAKITSLFILSLKSDIPMGSVIVYQYARWAVLSWILAVRSVSKPVRKQYPNMLSLQMKGVLLERERVILERAETEGNTTPRPLVVIDWMLLLLKRCSVDGYYNEKGCLYDNVESLMLPKKIVELFSTNV